MVSLIIFLARVYVTFLGKQNMIFIRIFMYPVGLLR